MKIKIKALDKLFSIFVRTRDKWTCQRCFTTYPPPTNALHCSHFHGRRKQSVRFDEDNAVAFCFGCHKLMEENPVDHCNFFLKRLGQKDYDLLQVRAETIGRPDYELLKIKYKAKLKELEGPSGYGVTG